MKELELISIPVYEFRCDEQLTDEILDQVSKLDFKENTTNSIAQDTNFYHKELFDWFDSCIKQAKEKIKILDSLDLTITACWANKTSKVSAHHDHVHPNSFLSGVFYLTSHESSHTIFYHKNPWHFLQDFFYVYKDTSLLQAKIQPEKGKLILFPSNMRHRTKVLTENQTRYSLSFNTFFSGVTLDNMLAARLQLNSESVIDQISK